MRILILNSGYLTATISGGDRHLLEIGSALASEHAVTYVVPNFVHDMVPSGARSVLIRSWPPRSLAGICLTYFLRTMAATRAALRQPAEAVFASPGLFDLIPALLNKRRYGSRVALYWFHINAPVRNGSKLARWQSIIAQRAQAVSLYLSRQADTIFTSADEVRDRLISLGFASDRVVIQQPAVRKDLIAVTPVLPSTDLMFIGRLVRKKGVFDLVKMAERLDATLSIVGDGEERLALEQQISQRGLDMRVHLLGRLSDAEMYGRLKGCKVFVFPSYEEGYGIAIAEALLAGKPVVAYSIPHYRKTFANRVIEVEPGNIPALERAVISALSAASNTKRCDSELMPLILGPREAAKAELEQLTGQNLAAAQRT